MTDTWVSVKEFAKLLDCHVSSIWRRVKLVPGFPQPERHSSHATRWLASDIAAWLGRDLEYILAWIGEVRRNAKREILDHSGDRGAVSA